MKRLMILMGILAGSLIFGNIEAQAQIDFKKGSWDEVKAMAKKQDKPIFVDAYTTWCGPCRWMSANVFTDKEVGNFFNENFVSYKFDMEKGEGPAFARANGVRAYPTLIFFDSNGKEVHRVLGAKPADQFLKVGKDAQAKAGK